MIMRIPKKFTLILLLMSHNSFQTAYAEPSWQLALHADNMDEGEAVSLRLQTGDYLYGGLSINYIKSNRVIQVNDRKRIYPTFLFMGLKYPSKVTPFIEGAVDLPEAIFDELFDDDDNAIDLTDYYLSSGVQFPLGERVSLLLYARKYVFKYQQNSINDTRKVRADSFGAGLSIRF